MKMTITIGNVTTRAELNDTETAEKIAAILPYESDFHTWGDEIYFTVPVSAGLDDTATERLVAGDLGFWPNGNAFCIFYGPTPMSSDENPVPASAVNIIGRLTDDPSKLKTVNASLAVRLEKEK